MTIHRPHWDLRALSQSPQTHPAPDFGQSDVRPVFFDALPFKGKPTQAFAWIGLPEGEGPFPGMVLVHGGGGTAFADWVRRWTARGYAAIAMDVCGCVPEQNVTRSSSAQNTSGNWMRHEHSGPKGWGGFESLNDAVEDQWMYHAVADTLLAHSLLRSFPEIEADRVGLTGISWGGVIACIAAAVDRRFGCVAPVYGCGFLDHPDTTLFPEEMDEEARHRWLDLWDPAHWLVSVRTPMLWVTGTNDFAFPLPSWGRSHSVVRGESRRALRVNMPHGHGDPGEGPPEIPRFTDHHLLDETNLVGIRECRRDGTRVQVRHDAARPLQQAELCWSASAESWTKREWTATPCTVSSGDAVVEADLPAQADAWFVNLIDASGCVSSTAVETLEA